MLLVAIGVIVSGAAAVFTWVQAHAAVETLKDARAARDDAQKSAVESARLAGEANAAFIRQAEAQEEANRIKREEMTPDDWSTPTHVSGSLWRVTNTSQRLLLVDKFEVEPDGAVQLVRVRTNHQDGRYEYGDSFEFMRISAAGLSPEKLTVVYRYEDDAEDDSRKLHIGL
jgi:hypothetical protein